MNLIYGFFSSNNFMPHGYCINWSAGLLWSFVISDTLIFFSYLSMPLALGYFARMRKDFPYKHMLWMFAVFILACGATHLMSAIVLWQPLYHLDAAVKIITAVVSLIAAGVLWPLIPQALRLPSPEQLRLANVALQEEVVHRRSVEKQLEAAKSAVEDLLATERVQLTNIVESSADAIIGIDLAGNVSSWNPAAERMFGYSAAEIMQRPITRIYPAERSIAEQELIARVGRGERIDHFETVRSHKDGSHIAVSVSLAPIFNKQGYIVGVSNILRDITASKVAEAEIRRLNAELEQRVEERTAELQAANRELDAFAHAVSHDLRAPLRAMRSFSQALQEDFGETLNDEARDYLNEIIQASHKMGDLIDGILTLSRSTRGELRRDTIDLSSLAEEIRRELTYTAPDRNIDWQIEPGLSAIGDKRMIEAVLRNLLGNAWKYSKHAASPCIRFYAEQQNGVQHFCVADNGAGFDVAYADRLFKPFQRLHRQNEFPGLGIGLATVQRIIHRHGGEIHAAAAPGKGAIFCFVLPGDTVKEIKT